MTAPTIIYIPGLKPKPEPALHRAQLLRCLVAGVERVDAAVASAISEPEAFQLISWTYDFYGAHHDIALDLADIDAVVHKERASEEDIVTATSWRRRFAIWLFHAANYLPFLLPQIAPDEIEVHLRDFFRYVRNDDGCGATTRQFLIDALEASDGPVLLLAHSMGSVIAWDTLWQLSHETDSSERVSLLLTAGSPLGQQIVQRRLSGRGRPESERYPTNIDRWINIAAVGELTAIDRRLRKDFRDMIRLGLVDDIVDHEVFNYYHMHGALNVHAEYGYLVNESTANVVVDWWRANTPT